MQHQHPLSPSGCAIPHSAPQAECLLYLVIMQCNSSPQRYTEDHKRLPDRVIVATETFPADSIDYWIDSWEDNWVLGNFIWTAIDYIGESSIGNNGHNTPSPLACGAYCAQPWPYHVSFVCHRCTTSISIHTRILHTSCADFGLLADSVATWTWSEARSPKLTYGVYCGTTAISKWRCMLRWPRDKRK
eukprot:COSAG02_NODE_652_length_18867_cov_30.656756_6_plen_188_part_00